MYFSLPPMRVTMARIVSGEVFSDLGTSWISWYFYDDVRIRLTGHPASLLSKKYSFAKCLFFFQIHGWTACGWNLDHDWACTRAVCGVLQRKVLVLSVFRGLGSHTLEPRICKMVHCLERAIFDQSYFFFVFCISLLRVLRVDAAKRPWFFLGM